MELETQRLATELEVLRLSAHSIRATGLGARLTHYEADPDSALSLATLSRTAASIFGRVRPIIVSALELHSSGSVEIDDRWLAAWFCQRMLSNVNFLAQHGIPVDETASLTLSVNQALRFLDALCSYSRFVLLYSIPHMQSSPIVPDVSEAELVDDAQLLLLSEWAHFVGSPRSVPILKWLESLQESELALYALSPRGSYRQHIYHMQGVCILGLVLLSAKCGYRRLWPTCEDGPTEALWCTAALLHDVGQAIEVTKRSLRSLQQLSSSPLEWLGHDISRHLREARPEFDTLFAVDPTTSKASATLNAGNHGAIGAAMLSDALRRADKSGSDLSAFAAAVAAILDHDSDLGPIDMSKDPIGALLLLCDQIQESGRTRLDAKSLSRFVLAHIHHDSPISDLHEARLAQPARLRISGVTVRDGILRVGRKAQPEIEIDLGSVESGPSEPCSAWLAACQSLQRVAWSIPWRISIRHEFNPMSRGADLDRLYRISEEHSELYGQLGSWAQLASRGLGGLDHTVQTMSSDDAEERLAMNLPEIGKHRPLKCSIENLYETARKLPKARQAAKGAKGNPRVG